MTARAVLRRPSREQGSAALPAIGLAALLVTATLVLAVLGGLAARQRRLESAADLAAVAGAAALQRGGNACADARTVAAANGFALVACAATGEVVEVVAGESTGLPLGRRVRLRARARAGPVTGRDPAVGSGPAAGLPRVLRRAVGRLRGPPGGVGGGVGPGPVDLLVLTPPAA